MTDQSCKFCGGGKFIRFSTWMECWYCGSEYERPPKTEMPQVIIQLPLPPGYGTSSATYGFGGDYPYHPRYDSRGRFR